MSFKKQMFDSKSKILSILILLVITIIILIVSQSNVVLATDKNYEEIVSSLTGSVDSIVSGIDFSGLDDLISKIEGSELFGVSIKDKINSILSGKYFTDYPSLLSAILSLLFIDFKKFLPILLSIISIGILSSIFSHLKSKSESLTDVVHFVLMAMIVVVMLVSFKNILKITGDTIGLISKQMSLIFPILIVLLSSIGSFSSIAIYNPMVAVLTSLVSIVFEKVLYPIFIVMFLFSILGAISKNVKLDKLEGFLNSSFKWVVGGVLTLFTGFLSIQGISAGRYDSISIKATKFAVKSYIPLIGSFISDGMDFLVLGSVLVKNTVGVVGILVLFVTIISPILTIVVTKLGIQLCAGIIEMSGGEKIGAFLNKCAKTLIYPIVIILGISFMYIITIALIICTANIF